MAIRAFAKGSFAFRELAGCFAGAGRGIESRGAQADPEL